MLSNFTPSLDRVGMLFEHLVLQLLLAHAKASDEDIRVSVYRTERGAEVDFIVELRDQVFAIEVKASKKVGTHDLTGLKSFADFYGKKKHIPIVIYLGNELLTINEIEIYPLITGIERLFSLS